MNSKIKIWLVEDEALIAQNLQFTLEDLGYEVVGQSYNFESGLEAIKTATVDLMFLDINLGNRNPERNGLALAKHLPQFKNIPFIFLTAYSDKDTILRATELRPSAYLIKPSNAATLFAAVQTAIENHRTNQAAVAPTEKPEPPTFFFSKIGIKLHKIHWHEVAKLEAIKNYVSIKTFNATTEYLIRGSLIQVMQSMMPPAAQQDFIQINRGIYLHRKAIKSVEAGIVVSVFGDIERTKEIVL